MAQPPLSRAIHGRAEPGAAEIEVLPSGRCEQEEMLRDGRADVALMHAPFNSLAGLIRTAARL
jgi:hypothetical protein